MGMSLGDVLMMRLPELRACFRAHAAAREADHRNRWERTRTLGCMMLQPWAKGKLDPREMLPLPWDGEQDRKPARRKRTKEQELARLRYFRAHGVWPETVSSDSPTSKG